MADILYLPDGSMEVIFSRDDFQRLIYEKLGSDAEQKLIEIINESECFNDLLDSIEEIKKLLQQQRIDRRKIYEVLDQMEIQITNQI